MASMSESLKYDLKDPQGAENTLLSVFPQGVLQPVPVIVVPLSAFPTFLGGPRIWYLQSLTWQRPWSFIVSLLKRALPAPGGSFESLANAAPPACLLCCHDFCPSRRTWGYCPDSPLIRYILLAMKAIAQRKHTGGYGRVLQAWKVWYRGSRLGYFRDILWMVRADRAGGDGAQASQPERRSPRRLGRRLSEQQMLRTRLIFLPLRFVFENDKALSLSCEKGERHHQGPASDSRHHCSYHLFTAASLLPAKFLSKTGRRLNMWYTCILSFPMLCGVYESGCVGPERLCVAAVSCHPFFRASLISPGLLLTNSCHYGNLILS